MVENENPNGGRKIAALSRSINGVTPRGGPAQCILKTKTCLFPSENRAHKPDDVAQLADLWRRADRVSQITNKKKPPGKRGKTGGLESTCRAAISCSAHRDLTDSVSPFSGQNWGSSTAFCLFRSYDCNKKHHSVEICHLEWEGGCRSRWVVKRHPEGDW
jgi:hypothetical protein